MDETQSPQISDSVNVLNPENELVSIPKNRLQEAQNLGYKIPSPEDIHQYKIQKQYGEGIEPLKAAAEAAGRSMTFGLSTGVEKALGVSPEAIVGREEANPYAATAGELTGLLTPVGEGQLLGKLGQMAVPAALKGAGLASKIGSGAVKGLVESAAYQGGNEVHKMILHPDFSAQGAGAALVDIGLAGLIGAPLGGAFGAVKPLWQETVGKKLNSFLDATQRRINGEAVSLVPELDSAISKSGLELAPEVRTAFSDDPHIMHQWQVLQESPTTSGLEAQRALQDFRKAASDNMVKALEKDPEAIPTEISTHENGAKIQDKIAKDIEDRFEPISKSFNKIRDKFAKIPMKAEDDLIADRLSQLGVKEGWHVPSLPQTKLLNETLADLPYIKDLEGLRQYQSNLWAKAKGDPSLFNAAGKINSILRDVENRVLEREAGTTSTEVLNKLKVARQQYGEASEIAQSLNERLHAGKFKGPESFAEAIRDMKPEVLINRLTNPNDAGLLEVLQKNFPSIVQDLRNHQIDKMLSRAAIKAPEGFSINTKNLGNAIDKMSPEMKKFLFSDQALQRINATRTILDSLPERLNPSGTARTISALWDKMPGGATGMAGALLGHGIVGKAISTAAGYLIGQTAKWLGKDVPDAIRLSYLKFLGQSGPVNAGAFKTAVDFTHSLLKGEAKINKAVNGLFKAGQIIIPSHELPDKKSREQLDKKIKSAMVDPSQLLKTGGDLNYYMPDHAKELSATAARSVNYLSSLRPNTDKLGVLDKEREPSEFEKSKYNRALDLANNPLLIMHSIKDGSITPQDVISLRTIYPGLYEKLSNKIFDEIVKVTSNEGVIPYSTKLGLSMFLAQPLDSSMKPDSIRMNQPMPVAQQSQGQIPASKSKSLTKLASTFQTPDQTRMAQKQVFRRG